MEDTCKKNKKQEILCNLDKFLQQNQNTYNEADLETIKKYYLNHYESINRLTDINSLFDYSESILKKCKAIELEIYEHEPKKITLQNEWLKHQENRSIVNKKFQDKEKYSQMLIDKLNAFNKEKTIILQDEAEKRNLIIKETEDYVRSLQEKCEADLPDRKRVIEENIFLRKEIEDTIKSSFKMKDLLQNEFIDNQKSVENSIKNNLKNKIHLMTMQSQRIFLENAEIKTQNVLFRKKIEEMENTKNLFKREWDKLNLEIEKKKENIMLYSAENYEIQLRIKSTNKTLREKSVSDINKIKIQLNSMKSLNKKLNEQLTSIKGQTESKNNNTSDNSESVDN